jgi:hypothetical protein
MPTRHARWPILAAVALVLAAYAWTWHNVGPARFYREPQDYYGSLTDALLSGHLYLKIAPDPRLAALADPWASYQGIPRLHDATYFHGRYYLYFGVTPVLVLLGPWRLLTGTFLTEGAAAVIFGLVGFLAGLDLLRRLTSKLAAPLSPWWRAAGVVVWGIGTFAFVLMQFPIFYVVPILAAYACLMCAFNAVARAVDAATPPAAARWLAAASLAWGMAVGARPQYVFSLTALLLPLAVLLFRGAGTFARGRRSGLILATVFPAAAFGAFLAWYNYARFGTPFEFGFRYQFTGGDQRFIKLWNPSLIGPNLAAYLFLGLRPSVYFPFVIPTAGIIGMAAAMPLAVLAAAFPFTFLDRQMRRDATWLNVGLCALAAGCIHLLSLCILPIGSARYLVDFTPPFMIAALAAAVFILAAVRRPRRWAARGLAFVVGVLGAVTAVNSGFLALQSSRDHRTRGALARLFNRPVAALETALGTGTGPVQLELSLRDLVVGQHAPLVATGPGTDFLYVQRTDSRHLRFGFVHLGDPELKGAEFSFDPAVRHTVVADLGSLYPPDEHPALAKWSPSLRDALHRRVNVTLDGTCVLHGASAFFPSDPLHTYIGRHPIVGYTTARFPGAIYRVSRQGMLSRATVENDGWTGPVRLHLQFPPFSYFLSEPLITSGARNAGDMIYVTYLAPGRVRFGHDSNQGGAVETADVIFDPGTEHTLDVDFAPLKAPPGIKPDMHKAFQLRFDGRWLICADRPTFATHPYEVTFGFNAIVMGTAKDSFSGPLLRPERIAPFPPPEAPGKGTGPLEITLRFRPWVPGVREPLAVTGRTGAGDFVYIIYEANNRFRLGVDHWGVGGVVSDPIVDSRQVHTITVTSAALFPPQEDPAWHGVPDDERARSCASIRVEMDGRTIIDAPFHAYPTTPEEIDVGQNRIGGSTTGTQFTGDTLMVRRLGLPPATR